MVVGLWVLAFGLGSIPFGYLLGRLRFGADIRQHGSQNIGATNVARTFGVRAGLAVLALDALKGLAAVWVARAAMPHPLWVAGLAGTCAILGHVFSPFMRFRGGKGVATGLGVAIGLSPLAAVGAAAAFFAVVGVFRIISLGSLVGMLTLLAILAGTGPVGLVYSYGVPSVLVSIWAHRHNWSRLVRGQEPRFGKKTGPRP